MRNRFNYSGFPDLTAPSWAGRELLPEDLLPGGAKLDDTAFTAFVNPVTVTLTAAGVIGDAALAVTALTGPLPAGQVLNFGKQGQIAVVAQNVAAAAVSIPVIPITSAIDNGAVAQFLGRYGKAVPAGTFVSRTFAQRAAGTGFHPALVGEDEYFLTAFDVKDTTLDNDVSLVLPGDFVVKENYLPGFAGLAGGVVTLLRGKYVCTLGA